MGKYFSDRTEEGIRLVWMQFDREKIKEGQQLLNQSVKEGEADAYCFLARSCMGTFGLAENMDMAFDLLREGAKLGSSCSIITMLQFRKLAKEVEKLVEPEKLKEVVADVRKKAEDGHAYCQLMMGMYYFWGGNFRVEETEEDSDEDKAVEARMSAAAPWYEKALYNGLTVALVNLIDIYEADEASVNEGKPEKALRFAANCGDPMWIYRFSGWLFENEKYEESMTNYLMMAEGGYASTWYDVGFQYEKGLGTPLSMEKAVEAYNKGADAGVPSCERRLGKLLLWGKGIPKDEAQAYFWFSKGAEHKDEIAKMFKGHCLLYGLGVKKNEDEGTTLLYDALNYNYPGKGESQAMAEESNFDWEEDMLQLFWDLGDAYENGLGVPKREHLAGYYFSMVADGGWPEAIEKMTHYKEGMFKRWKRIK